MTLTATIRTHEDDRLYAVLHSCEVKGEQRGNVWRYIVEDDGDTTRPFRDQITAWAEAEGHEISAFKMELKS